MVKAVIFDVDGTLIDSVDLHARAWQEIFLKYGVRTDFQAVRDQIGKGGDKLMKVFLLEEQIERQGKEIEEERTKLFVRRYLPLVKPFPGLQGLFERLRDDGIKIALASSAKDKELETYKKITGIEPFLAEDTSSDDVSNSKPDPDIFLTARKKLGVDALNAIAIGDTQYDAESAAKAGMRTIGVLCGGSSPTKLTRAGCIALYRDPADLLRNYDHSPLSQGAIHQSKFSRRGVEEKTEESMSSNRSLFFLIGVAVGTAVGTLIAPKSGSETRAFLKRKSEEGTEYAGRVAADTAEAAKQTAADSIERGKQILQESAKALSPEVATLPKEQSDKSQGESAKPAT